MKHFLDQQRSPEDLDGPLSPHELNELAGMLVSDATPDECMSISELDGFFTALVVGPTIPDPDLWMPVVWGRRDSLRFMPDEAVVFGQSIGRLMLDIHHGFEESPPRFAPIIELAEDGKVVITAEDWCSGFMKGVSLNAADWEPILADHNHGISLLPMMTLGTETGLRAIENAKDPGAEYDKVVGLLHCAVTFVHSYWRSRSSGDIGGSTIPGINPRFLRPGRNSPCACGSGRKFKRCCANPTGV